MFQIVEIKELVPTVKQMKIYAPLIASRREAGQFIILRCDQKGERIPLTIVNSDPCKGTITIIFQEVGKSTFCLGQKNAGDYLPDVVGPLGRATHLEKFADPVVCLGGGVGIAPLLPIAKAFKEKGNRVISIIGARTKDLLILEDEMRAVSDYLIITTDDGSYGLKGFVNQPLQEKIAQGEKIGLVMAIGPVPMMKAVVAVARLNDLPTMVSLNPIMIDGTGMCGGCRVSVGGKTKFACVDGPEFDGLQVDFAELSARLAAYCEQEKEAIVTHKCKIEVR